MATLKKASDNDILKVESDEHTPLLQAKVVGEGIIEDETQPRPQSTTSQTPSVIAEEAEKIEKELEKIKQMRVLIVGKSGVGKSSFLNSLFQADLARVGRVKPETSEVNEYILTTKENGVTIIVYDTPGFGTNSKENRKNIKEMRKKCELVDVIFLCIRMDDQLRVEDKLTISLLAKEFDDRFWRKLLVVFTRANMVQPMGQHKEQSPKVYLQSVRDELKGDVVETLQKAKITEPPFVIAGAPEFFPELRMIPDIEDASSDESEIDWLPAVASKILRSGCSDNGKAVLIKSGWGKWAQASAASGVGMAAGTAAGACIVLCGVAALAIPPLGVTVITVGGAVIAVSLAAGGTSTVACGATAGVKKSEKKSRVKELSSKMTTKTEKDPVTKC